MFRLELLGRVAYDLSKLLWDAAIRACHFCQHRHFAIALDKLDRKIEVQQTHEGFTGHWARNHIAPGHDKVYFCLTNIPEDSLQCGEVPVNIINCSNSHDQTLLKVFTGVAAE